MPELITGKRKWAHGTSGEDAGGPAVIYYYKIRNEGGIVSFDRYDIDPEHTSGVGIQIIIRDMNGDGVPDIVMSNKTGLYYFEQLYSRLAPTLGLPRSKPLGRSSMNPTGASLVRAPRRIFSPPPLMKGPLIRPNGS